MSQTVVARDGDTGRSAKEGKAQVFLSDLHRALAGVERQTDPHHLNRLINDKSIEPWVRGYALGRLDATGLIADPSIIVLGGEFAAAVFRQVMPGLYDFHVQCLPEGRGPWMLLWSKAVIHWMFCRTDAMEIIARLPDGHVAVKAYARSLGFRHRFSNPKGWVKDIDPVPCEIVSILIQDWMEKAPGLIERGHWFFDKAGLPPEDDAEVTRFTGLGIEMLLSGQPMKALVFFNRWADMAGRPVMQILTMEPLAIEMMGTKLIFRPESESFWVV